MLYKRIVRPILFLMNAEFVHDLAVFTAEHAYEKMKAGASLVQVYSGFIYNGPTTVYNINKGLIKLLREDGYGSIQEFRDSVLNKI
jgi:dihydroorotate dehydrogenase